MSRMPWRRGAYTSLATDFTPEVRLCVLPLRSSEIRDSDRMTRTMTVSVRRDRRDRATQRKPVDTSARGGGYQHPLQRFELFQALSAAHGHAIERVARHDDRHPGLVLEARLEAMKQGASARQHDALLHDVRSQLRRRPVQGDLHGVDDGRD